MHRHRAIIGSYVRHDRGSYVRSQNLVVSHKKRQASGAVQGADLSPHHTFLKFHKVLKAAGAVQGADLSPSRAQAITPPSYLELRKRLVVRKTRLRSIQSYRKTALNSMRDRPDPAYGYEWGQLGVDPALEAKARTDRAYREFIGAVASACASPEAESLEVADFAISEKRDLESPSWLKLILRVDFVGGDFTNKRERRMRLRSIVNERISSARDISEVRDCIDEMKGRFFIIASW